MKFNPWLVGQLVAATIMTLAFVACSDSTTAPPPVCPPTGANELWLIVTTDGMRQLTRMVPNGERLVLPAGRTQLWWSIAGTPVLEVEVKP